MSDPASWEGWSDEQWLVEHPLPWQVVPKQYGHGEEEDYDVVDAKGGQVFGSLAFENQSPIPPLARFIVRMVNRSQVGKPVGKPPSP